MIVCDNHDHVDDLYEIVVDFNASPDLYNYIRTTIKIPNFRWFLSDDKETCVLYEPVGEFRCQGHLMSISKKKGKKVKEFATDSGNWILDNTQYNEILSFVKKDNRPMMMMLGILGFKRVGELKEELLYSYWRDEEE